MKNRVGLFCMLVAVVAGASACTIACADQTMPFIGAAGWVEERGALALTLYQTGSIECGPKGLLGTVLYDLKDGTLSDGKGEGEGAVASSAVATHQIPISVYEPSEEGSTVRMSLLVGNSIVWNLTIPTVGPSAKPIIGPNWVSLETGRAYYLAPNANGETVLVSVALDGTAPHTAAVDAPQALLRSPAQSEVRVYDQERLVRFAGNELEGEHGCVQELLFAFADNFISYRANSSAVSHISVALPSASPVAIVTLNTPTAFSEFSFTTTDSDGKLTRISFSTKEVAAVLGIAPISSSSFDWTALFWVTLSVTASLLVFCGLVGGAYLFRKRLRARQRVEFHL